jgi:hypothetical protein
VRCGPRKPAAQEEKEAVLLDDPSLSLRESGVTGTAWLLAFVASPPGSATFARAPQGEFVHVALLPSLLELTECPDQCIV